MLATVLLAPAVAQADDCPNAAVRAQQGATDLAACRAYELVSPEHQGFPTGAGPGNNIPNTASWVASDGAFVAYPSFDAFVGASGAPLTVLGSREASRWTSTGLFPPAPEVTPLATGNTVAVSEDGSKLLLTSPGKLLPTDTDAQEDLYLNDVDTGLTLVTPDTPDIVFYVGRAEDLSHVLFHTVSNLVPEASGTAMKLYEWVDGSIRLVGIRPDGTVNAGGSVLGRREDGTLTNSLPLNALTDDAESIVFTSPAPSKSVLGNRTKVYVRQGGTTTIEASASKCTRMDCNAVQNVNFAGASRDGSTVFMQTTQQLTNDDIDSVNDLYAFDVGSGGLARLTTSGIGLPTANGAHMPVFGTSEDGQTVYARLTATGKVRIALLQDGTVTEIGSVTNETVAAIQDCTQPGVNAWGVPQVTPDGEVLVFSAPDLTPSNPAHPSGAGIYRYDASTGDLIKIAASGSLPSNGYVVSDLDCYLRRGVTDDGERVFFTSNEALVPQDDNGAPDVYGWADGEVSLISSGKAELPSDLLGVSAPNGRDVFFTTTSPLVPQDQDTVGDVYDARVGGGFPFVPPPAGCVGDGCRGSLAGRPGLPRAGSATLLGDGNLVDRRLRLVARVVGGAAGRRLAARGRLAVSLRSGRAVQVGVRVRTRIGGRQRTVASSLSSVGPRRRRVVLSLSDGARARLAAAGRLRVVVVVRGAGLSSGRRLSAVLSVGR